MLHLHQGRNKYQENLRYKTRGRWVFKKKMKMTIHLYLNKGILWTRVRGTVYHIAHPKGVQGNQEEIGKTVKLYLSKRNTTD